MTDGGALVVVCFAFALIVIGWIVLTGDDL